MNYAKDFVTLAAAGVLSALPLQAQNFTPQQFLDTETLNVTLTALVQGDSQDISHGNTSGTKDTAVMFKINNKTILQQLGAPAGAKLVLLGGSTLGYQVGKNTTDTGVPITFNAPNIVVDKGQSTDTEVTTASGSSSSTLASAFSAKYLSNVTIDLTGTSTPQLLSLTGLTSETSSSSERDTDTSSSFGSGHTYSISGAGEGSVSGADAVITGKITSAGKQNSSGVD